MFGKWSLLSSSHNLSMSILPNFIISQQKHFSELRYHCVVPKMQRYIFHLRSVRIVKIEASQGSRWNQAQKRDMKKMHQFDSSQCEETLCGSHNEFHPTRIPEKKWILIIRRAYNYLFVMPIIHCPCLYFMFHSFKKFTRFTPNDTQKIVIRYSLCAPLKCMANSYSHFHHTVTNMYLQFNCGVPLFSRLFSNKFFYA